MGKYMARFTNQAQLRYGNNVANSNIAVGEILEVLSATKTAVKNTYNQNDTITYVVSIVNSGNTAINGLTLSDNLGAYTFNTNTLVPLTYVNNTVKYYTNGTLQAAPAVTQGPPLSITGINVPAGGNATVIYEAALNEYAPLGIEAAVTNTATVSGTGITPVTAAETVNAEAAPNLAITKSVSPVPVTENGTLTYTFRIQNYGSVAATNTTGVVITDTFAPVLNNLTAALNGTAWTAATDYTYNEATGTFSSTVNAEAAPNLAITKSVSPVPVTENGTLTYTFRIQNYGSVAATNTTGVVITDTFAPVLNNLTAALNGTAWTAATDYTYNEATGTFSSTAGAITVPAATYTQDSTTGAWVVTPGESTLVITGTV